MEILFWYFIVTRYDHINHIFTILIHYFDNVYIFFGMGIANILTCINILVWRFYFTKQVHKGILNYLELHEAFLIYNTFKKIQHFLRIELFPQTEDSIEIWWKYCSVMNLFCKWIPDFITCICEGCLKVMGLQRVRLFWKHKI